ncbi:hypothetical protein RB195_003663 [Necator americanus]|uniref:Uncharacterized protein n=1 Tax=Necator americanus TaxID=51031 RepID=A0ABR1DPK8_NECAM
MGRDGILAQRHNSIAAPQSERFDVTEELDQNRLRGIAEGVQTWSKSCELMMTSSKHGDRSDSNSKIQLFRAFVDNF